MHNVNHHACAGILSVCFCRGVQPWEKPELSKIVKTSLSFEEKAMATEGSVPVPFLQQRCEHCGASVVKSQKLRIIHGQVFTVPRP